jgi:hypothetical protein
MVGLYLIHKYTYKPYIIIQRKLVIASGGWVRLRLRADLR